MGAAVLMAAAIILIPEMLGGPDHSQATQAREAASQTRSQSHGDAPIKTYTIDLSRSPGTQPVVAPDDTRVPPPEEMPAPVAQSTSVATSVATSAATSAGTTPPAVAANGEGGASNPQPAAQAEPEPGKAPGTNATDRATVARAPVPTPRVVEPPTPADRALATGSNAPTSGAWAVQLGSFSKLSTAERLVKELRGKGHEAFVMPVRSGSSTLYRVRIGPMKDRASAQATLQAVLPIAPGAAVVSQP